MRGEQSVLGGWMDIIHLVCRERERINGGRGVLKDLVPLCGPAVGFCSRAADRAVCV
jgi:hypothetical protein